jgi:hypothetical protein
VPVTVTYMMEDLSLFPILASAESECMFCPKPWVLLRFTGNCTDQCQPLAATGFKNSKSMIPVIRILFELESNTVHAQCHCACPESLPVITASRIRGSNAMNF